MIYPPHQEALLQGQGNRILRANVSQTLEEFGLSMLEWILLGVLSEKEGLRLSQAAEVLDVEPPLITVLAKDLQAKGLIELQPDQKDNRAKQLTLTKQGSGLARALEFVVHKNLEPLMAGISDQDISGYFAVLEGIIANGSTNK